MFLKTSIFFLFNLIMFSNSLITPIPTKTYTKTIPNVGDVSVIEPFYNNKDTNAVVFFTGGSSNIPNIAYSSFLYLLSSQNITSYTFNNKINRKEFSRFLNKKHKKIGLVGHSSGCMTALKTSNYFSDLKNIILFDPVDDRVIENVKNDPIKTILGKNEKNIKISVPENFIIVKSMKSYNWNFNPFKTPFIPFFGLEPENIELTKKIDDEHDDDYDDDHDDDSHDGENITITKNINPRFKSVINLHDYGHCDILDSRWADIMHNSFAYGVDPRNEDILENYRSACSYVISSSFEDIKKNQLKNIIKREYNIKSSVKRL